MVIEIIADTAEQQLLSLVEQGSAAGNWGVLYFRTPTLGFRPEQEDLLLTVRPVLQGTPAALYFFRNHDFVITWQGMQRTVLEALCSRLYERYAPNASEKLHQYYDLQAQGEELRLLCKRYIDAPNTAKAVDVVAVPRTTSPPTELLRFSEKQLHQFRHSKPMRARRTLPETLVVEDQPFSAKLLTNMLNRTYRTYWAHDAEQALELYSQHAPDIVFLDVELPDMNGHALAAVLRLLDPDAYIVMVTANHYAQDVLRAKENQVKGFIAKPYNKQKIESCVEKFRRTRR